MSAHRSLIRESGDEWSVEILSPDDQQQYDRLHAVLTATLGLDWKAPAGFPDGEEIADDCAAALWDAGFRTTHSPTPHGEALRAGEVGK